MAHDGSLLGQGGVELFPECANWWRESGVKGRTRWKFLEDFENCEEGEGKLKNMMNF